jgi:porphobilinogen synthase
MQKRTSDGERQDKRRQVATSRVVATDATATAHAPAAPSFPSTRLRRNRKAGWIRALVAEHTLSVDDLIWPLFLIDVPAARTPVQHMPGVDRLNIAEAVRAAEQAAKLGIPAIAPFPYIDKALRDPVGSEAVRLENLMGRAVRAIKAAVPHIGVVCDVALDPYTSHGHDGLMTADGRIDNDPTLAVLVRQALALAAAGADCVAPSDMMDGRIGAIRRALDQAGYQDVQILSYAAKYASGFYGPFRDAIGTSATLVGDKRTYQMDPANTDEALREVALDLAEGADMVMVKPGMPYLDIVRRVADAFSVPTFAYQVSGEYAMLTAAAQNGWLDGDRVMLESLLAFKRAGASGVLTYFAPRAAKLLAKGA